MQTWPTEDRLHFKIKETGMRVSSAGVTKILTQKLGQARLRRLRSPADPTQAKHGQGVYLRESLQGRSLAWKKITQNKDKWGQEMGWIRRYMMNNYNTRDFRHRHKEHKTTKEVSTKACPVCQLAGRGVKTQTKEHYFTGECKIAETIIEERNIEMTKIMKEAEVEKRHITKIMNMIQQEQSQVVTHTHTQWKTTANHQY